jgi:uncharacterized protein (TIGR00661 family)
MNQPQAPAGPRILVAPLDWGLGHATRCISIINTLIHENCSVFLAGKGKVRRLLEKEFPKLPFLPLEGYNIRYSAGKWTLPFAIGLQVPKIISVIKKEHRWLSEMNKKYQFDAVISDNRYGLYHKKVFSVFITHQLKIKTPFGRLSESFLQYVNFRHINRFSECWVPDHKGAFNLAGNLSHPAKMPAVPTHYTGPISRFEFSHNSNAELVVILLSGPEPQRTILEKMILPQLNDLEKPVVLVRGLPGNTDIGKVGSNVTVHDHLPAKELNDLLLQAAIIISRCGYSTIMDIAALKKKSILIPTPGQTEQEYLSTHLMKLKLALCIEQKKFRLKQALDLAKTFPFAGWTGDHGDLLSQTVQNLLGSIALRRSIST